MQGSSPARVFISYAHKDGSQLAQRLRHDIAREGYEVWFDSSRLDGGASWTTEIELALDKSDVVLALLSRGSFISDTCRAEQLRSLRKGKCVIPILAQPEADRPLHLEARNYRDLSSDPTYCEQFPRLLEDIRQRTGVAIANEYRQTYVTVPPLPVNYVERRRELEALRNAVLDDASAARRVALTALKGMAGIGKTILAQALCLDEVIQAAFPDGIVWLNVGKEPRDLVPLFREAARAVGDLLEGYDSLQSASTHLRNHLRDKAVLLVLDDVWNPHDAAPFLMDSPRSRLLITTRDARTAVSLGAHQQSLDVLTWEQSLQLVSLWSDCPISRLPLETAEVIRECGCLPLALAMVGALLRGKPDRWKNILQRLRDADLGRLRQSFPEYPYPDLLRTIDVSVEALEDEVRERYLKFAVFPEDNAIPEAAIRTLWRIGQYDVEDTLDQLLDLSLMTRDSDNRFRIHDLLLDYVRLRLGSEQVRLTHKDLLQSYRKQCPHHWSDGPADGYFFENITWHLRKAGQVEDAFSLVMDLPWINAKLRACGIISVLSDYEWCASDNRDARLVQEALHLSAHVLATHPNQLASQLLSRLPPGSSEAVDLIRAQSHQWSGPPWLRPLRNLLTGPGGPLMFTLVGHTGRVRTVALTPSGDRAVSGSDDNSIKVWDLRRGALERTLTGHSDWVRAVSVLKRGDKIVSASDDHTLKVWNLTTGREERSIQTYLDWIRALICLPDGVRVATVSDDRAIKIWNLESAALEQVLRGHSAEINCIAVTPDGCSLVSGGDDRTLRIWCSDQRASVQVLKGHQARVTAITSSSDGQHIISASADETVLLWKLQTASDPTFRTLVRRTNIIRSLAITPDDKIAIGASEDNNLHLWDLDDGKERLFLGHSDCVNSVTVTPDGRCAVSGSDDSTIKVWDLTRPPESGPARDHTDRVRALAVTPDGQNAISSSDDHTFRIWDMLTGLCRRTIHNQHHWVFALTPDGMRVISAGGSGSCSVWELSSGAELARFERHQDRVRAVAATPNGKRAVSCGDDRTIRVWNIDTGVEELIIQLARNWPRAVAISPDSRFAITAVEGNSLKLWDLENGSELRTYQGHSARVNMLAISYDGRFAVSCSDDHTIRVWDLESGKSTRTINGHLAKVNSLALSPKGRFVASASDDSDLKIWDLTNGEEIACFTVESPLLACAASSGGPNVVAGDRLGLVHFLTLEGIAPREWTSGNLMAV
jgi:WD40 repeat protein